jgi:hypothetical protein
MASSASPLASLSGADAKARAASIELDEALLAAQFALYDAARSEQPPENARLLADASALKMMTRQARIVREASGDWSASLGNWTWEMAAAFSYDDYKWPRRFVLQPWAGLDAEVDAMRRIAGARGDARHEVAAEIAYALRDRAREIEAFYAAPVEGPAAEPDKS